MADSVEVSVDVPAEENDNSDAELVDNAVETGKAIATADNAQDDADNAVDTANEAIETATAANDTTAQLAEIVAALSDRTEINTAMIINLAEETKRQNELLARIADNTSAPVSTDPVSIEPDIAPESGHWLNKKIGG